MTALVWQLEWRLALRRRRLLLLNVAIPLALVLPIAVSNAPPAHAAAVYAVLFVLFGTFGAAIPLVRDAEAGLLGRVAATGFSPRRLLLERTLAHASLDALQLLPALAAILLLARPAPHTATALVLPALLPAALVAANVLGAAVAALARSIAEAALFAAVAALFALHFAGVFRAPAPDTIGAAVEAWIPFHALHQALLDASGGTARPIDSLMVGQAIILSAAALALIVLAAPPLVGRLARGN